MQKNADDDDDDAADDSSDVISDVNRHASDDVASKQVGLVFAC